jgi:quinoprotein glucose dehydrogenase
MLLKENGVGRSRLRRYGMFAFAVLLIVTGAPVALLGLKLLRLQGSPYYLIIGLVWLVAGGLALWRRAAGLYLYAASFVATVIWALWESGLDGWALLPRLDLPVLYMVFATLLMPPRRDDGQRGYRRHGLALLAVTVIGLGIAVPLARQPYPVRANTTPAGTYFDPAIQPASKDWPTYGGGHGGQRYSTLTEISPANVDQLQRAWVYRTGEPHTANFGNELTPIKIGDTVYGCTIRHKMFAIDAATGKQKWMFDPKTSPDSSPPNSACRGVAYFANPAAAPEQACATRVIEGTLDAKLAAVDARTGQACEDFGAHGFVDLMQGMGKWPASIVSVTSAPTIVRGVVVTGQQVMDGQLRDAPSGVVRGYDAVTGALRFAWDMQQPGITTVPPEGKTYSLGTPNMWSTAVGDEELGLVYLPMASAAGDYMSTPRGAEERKYDSSVTALDVLTGKPRWVYQLVHNDVWDFDTPAQPSLVDFPTAAGNVPALIQTTKQGDLWVLDRRTGQPLHHRVASSLPSARRPRGGRSTAARRSRT